MRYAISFLEDDYDQLMAHVFGANSKAEQAAFLLAKTAVTRTTTTLLVRKIIPVGADDIESSSAVHMSIRSRAYRLAIKEADATGHSFIFVHSHPNGSTNFSRQDDSEEAVLFKTAHVRIHKRSMHASMIFSDKKTFCARAWFENGSQTPITKIRIIGKRFQYLYSDSISEKALDYFDRQARAFTRDFQPVLRRLHVGVIGVGGTGSVVCEQIVRLGIGTLTVVDPGTFEASNVNRVSGSSVFDDKRPKVNIAAQLAASIGLGTHVDVIQGHLSYRSVTERLRDCDVIFGCTDDQWGRSILNRLAMFYHIPVFDVGVNIDTKDERILGIQGRVTTLMPGTACLFCRKRISSEVVRAESIADTNPDEAVKLRKEGYLANMDEPAPSVVCFTSTIAAMAISEFLHRLTGFQGSDRTATELLCLFDQSRIRTNSTAPSPNCLCSDREKWGRGDLTRFLDLNWRAEQAC